MATFYLGLSMAGTVSAGTYTAGCLIELNRWLEKWRAALKAGVAVQMKAIVDVPAANIHIGDTITIDPNEIPNHDVKIRTLTGSSGGGVSGALYMIGLTTQRVEDFLKDTWLSFSIDKMTDLRDLQNPDAPIYSILGSLPIEEAREKIRSVTWGAVNPLKAIDYVEDVVELYMTLTSYEQIPYNMVQFQNTKLKAAIFENYFDYIRFGLKRDDATDDGDGARPFRFDLAVRPNGQLKLDNNWQKLVEATPATGAFPIGFQPRSVRRLRKEYDGKLFYLNYSIPSGVPYDQISPFWKPGNPNDIIDMEYFDGGTFNREPHDLARASLIRFLKKKGVLQPNANALPNKGAEALASVILIDPFATSGKPTDPGTLIGGLPALGKQPGLLIGALMGQGRFHTEWMEKTLNEDYYSRFLISPSRPSMSDCEEDYMLAGEPLQAFCGFLDEGFRLHDYKLGHYNTYRFLDNHFAVPSDNVIVTYGKPDPSAPPVQDANRLNKYRALGWLSTGAVGVVPTDFCQIIPRFEEPNNLNSILPDWPVMSQARWDRVCEMMSDRAYLLFRNSLELGALIEKGVWFLFAKNRVRKVQDKLKETLRCAKLIK